jgi:YegS/Rv2252/BmrU family lipid kinase
MPVYRVIINPYSHHQQTARLVPVIHELFAGMDAEFLVTTGPGHATELALNSKGAEVVVAVGGDGTVHEVVSGLMQHEGGVRPALGVIAAGSGNDAAKGFGLSLDVGLAAATLRDGQEHSFDVGWVNGRFFVGSCSVGLDALVVSKTIEYKAMHGWSGARLYYSALLYVITHELNPIALHLSIETAAGDTEETQLSVLLAAVTNGCTYGGGIPINPSAVPDDGALTLSWVDSMSTAAALARLPFIARGHHERLQIYHRRQIRRAVIESTSGNPLVAQTDGELFTAKRFEIETIPQALRVITPASR